MNLSILPVCNSLPSVLSQKHTSFIAALLEIDCFLPVVHCCFTDAVPLISGHGLKFCARALCTDHITSSPPHIQYTSAAYGLAYSQYSLVLGTAHREVPPLETHQ